ncbi:choline transporter-like 1 [Diabrotica virgifera virgifera]|uniref:Choline transporter-like protein n=1 Tax=Diabrotica virgifera virgifera TaxID=50390 RepID=A0ABM5JKU9_DIAVI|nr:choline transporter-like 1 [Diabrotica virgifera virgifera]
MGCCGSKDESRSEGVTERKCTDVFWLILFILFWFLMIIIAAFSFVYGNPLRIINGYDSFGNTCGTSNNKAFGNMPLSGIDTSEKKYLLFFDVRELKQSLKICVRECPKMRLNTLQDLSSHHRVGIDYCRYDFNYNELNNPKANSLSGQFGPCPSLPIYEGVSVLNRCVPKQVTEVGEAIVSNFYGLLNSWNVVEQVLGDLYSTWKEILGLTFLALVLSLLTISILHCLAHLVSYIIMIGFTIASIAGTAFLWYTYVDIKYHLNQTQKYMLLSESVRNETAFLWYSIIATIITVVILLIIVFMRKKVDFLADLFQETSKCVMHLPQLFIQPILTFAVLLLFFMFWLFVVLCLATASFPEKGEMTRNTAAIVNSSRSGSYASKLVYPSQTDQKEMNLETFADKVKISVVDYVDASWVRGMWWVYFIGLIWTSEFIMACQQMVIAGSVAHWFYKHKYKDESHCCYATGKLIKYHLGSVALGSLVITAFKIPRLILMYLHEKWNRGKSKGNECATCGLRCCICCFYCLEKFIRYLNHNAYTVIAIDGSNFCKAAGTAFEVLTANILQVATINSLGDFILFLGKCFVTAVTGCVGLALFRRDAELTFYAAPTLVVCIFAFFVAHCILSLYEMVLDTVYLCMCQSGDAPDGIKMQNLGVTTNGHQNAETGQLEAN